MEDVMHPTVRNGWHGSNLDVLKTTHGENRGSHDLRAFIDSVPALAWSALPDGSDRKAAEEALQASERNLSLIINTMPAFAWSARPDGSVEFLNERWLDHIGLSAEEARGWGWTTAIHPDDLERLTDYWRSIMATGEPGEIEARLRRFDGEYRWCLIRASALRDESGTIVKWYGTNTDIEDRKRAEKKLQQSEKDLLTITDAIANPIVVMAPDGTVLYANQVALDQTGLTSDDVKKDGFILHACHPDDIDRAIDERRVGLMEGVPFGLEMRLLRNGEYRWQLVQYNPLKDERGQIIRWYATATDINDQKRAEERLRHENVKLTREKVYLEGEVQSEQGFEEIIGRSSAIRGVLRNIETVAPTDSTVLIYGETGTGKELVARAVHERSSRNSKAFVKLNCAAIPTGLLESELFGHERGAFTGAIMQRVGRFELANHGTAFLDEIGEVSLELQPKLLRVLQEREFERLGSTRTIKTDARLIAATNRDLAACVKEGRFRADLFYRLNIFPIHVPPLRERPEDIPLLVRHFVQQFGRRMNRVIDTIPSETMEALVHHSWPGNIRELQNLIEHSVIVSTGPMLRVPLAGLQSHSVPNQQVTKHRTLEEAEREHILSTLKETQWVVSGPRGAAARLEMNRSTLQFRMRKLGIVRPWLQ